MSIGSSDTRKFGKWFQIRWAEKLGDPENPYLIRWTLILFGYSIRLHHWLRSDDRRYFHDHSSNLLSIVLKGWYINVTPKDPSKVPDYKYSDRKYWHTFRSLTGDLYTSFYLDDDNRELHFVEGIFNSFKNFLNMFKYSIWYSKATDRHYLSIPKSGAWTLLFEGRKYHKWGFYVPKNKQSEVRKLRPLRYFHKFGIIQTKDYQ